MDKNSDDSERYEQEDEVTSFMNGRIVEGLFIFTVALTVYFLLALLSYDAADPSWFYASSHDTVNNYAGKFGAWCADILFNLIGYGAFSIPLLLIYRSWLFFRYRDEYRETDWSGLAVVAIGMACVLFSVTGLSAINTPVADSALHNGNGGFLGEVIADEFLPSFGLAGGRLFLFTLFFFGVTISSNISWLALIESVGCFFVERFNVFIQTLKHRREAANSEALDEPDINAFDDSEPLSVEPLSGEQHNINGNSSAMPNEDWQEPVQSLSSKIKDRLFQRPIDDTIPFDPIQNNESSQSQDIDATDDFQHEKPEKQRLEPTFSSALSLPEQEIKDEVFTHVEIPLPSSAKADVVPVEASVGDAMHTNDSKLVPEQEINTVSAPKIIPSTKNREPSEKALNDKQEWLFDDADVLPSLNLLLSEPTDNKKGFSAEVLESLSRLLESKLLEFRIEAQVTDVFPGPVVTRFEIQPKPGTKASTITNLSSDLARSLAVQSVRVVEVIKGKSVIGIEIPNENREMVYFGSVIGSKTFEDSKSPLTVALGHDIGGQTVIADLAKMPHLLVAGTTGSGKSVGVNAMLLSLLYKATPEEVRLILVDPKMLELSIYDDIPHLLTPVITDMKDAANGLRWCVGEMERRYKLMSKLGVRNIAGFNKKVEDAAAAGEPILDPLWQAELEFMAGEDLPPAPALESLPYIVVVIDEFADMIMVVGKKVEELIARIAQKARAAGIHLILATQRPSVDIITGLIKANVPTRMAFRVSSKIDSRTILDQGGAEQLLGHGDMLYLPPGESTTTRVHGAFVADEEVHAVVESWKKRGKPNFIEGLLETGDSAEIAGIPSENTSSAEDQDALYDEAVAFVCETRKASISSVQRKLRIGYNRAARMIEAMEEAGVVSPMSAGGQREVLAPPAVTVN